MNNIVKNSQELVNEIERANNSKEYELLIKLCENYFEKYGRQEKILMLWADANFKLKKYSESIHAVTELIDRYPDNIDYKFNYAWMLQCKGDIDLAVIEYKNIINIDGSNPGAIVNYSNIISGMGEMCEAIKMLSRLTASGNAPAEAYNNVATFLKNIGEIEQAIEAYKIAILKDPKYIEAYYNLCMAFSYSNKKSNEVFNIHKIVGGMLEAGLEFTEPKIIDPQKKILNIGYVSADFRKHAVANFLMPVLLEHDKTKFKVHCYSNYGVEDDVTLRFKEFADSWTDITKISDVEAAQRIRDDGIDILIDLSGYTANTRLSIFAFKPAPVQITWLGYVATTGMKAIDWRLVDEYTEPSNNEGKYNVEKLYRLPKTFSVYLPPEGTPDISDLPYYKNDYITFGSFNYFGKVNDEVISHWAKVLISVKNSRLILKANSLAEKVMQERIIKKFEKFGIDSSRIKFYGKTQSYASHMSLYHLIDIALDTFPYSGATTTCEAMWMGVPVIVRETERMRIGVSMANNTGFGYLVAKNEIEYIDIAVKLAQNIENLNDIRTNMRRRLIESPLFNISAFVKDFEFALKDMYCTKYYSQKDRIDSNTVNKFSSVDELYENAVYLFNNKLLSEAEGIFRKIVAFSPGHVNSYFYLGLISEINLDATLAIGYFEKATILDKSNHVAMHKLALALFGVGKYNDAARALIKAINNQPKNKIYLCDLGVIYEKLKNFEGSEESFKQALAIDDNYYSAWYNFGNLLLNSSRLLEAKFCYQKALSIDANNINGVNNLALVELRLGNIKTSLDLMRKVVEENPDNVNYINNLATVLSQNGDDLEALKLLLPALQENENDISIIITSGNIFQKLGKLSEAVQIYEKGIELDSSNDKLLSNLGNCYKLMGRFSKAQRLLRHAIDLNNSNLDAYMNYANLCKDMSDIDTAITFYSKASSNNIYGKAHSGLCMSYLYSNQEVGKIFEVHNQIANLIEENITPYKHERFIDTKRIKVGYVSGDFRNHAISSFLIPVVSRHRKKDFEVYLFSNTQLPDSVSRQYKNYADHWVDIRGVSDYDVAKYIYANKIDILIDLSGHTADNRIQLFAYKAAPVQVSWLGYLFTTGLSRIDWRIVDAYTEISVENFNSEKRFYLEDAFSVYQPPESSPEIDNLPFYLNGYITFGSFNSLAKINDKVIELWSQVLSSVQDSKLLIKSSGADDTEIRNLILQKFTRHNIDSHRILFLEKVNSAYNHLKIYNCIDICLDTFPYPGVTTLCESIWMGVPVISMQNDRMNPNMSILNNANLSFLCAKDEQEFVKIAVNLTYDIEKLNQLRTSMRHRLKTSKLFDYSTFLNNIESAYLKMIGDYNISLAS